MRDASRVCECLASGILYHTVFGFATPALPVSQVCWLPGVQLLDMVDNSRSHPQTSFRLFFISGQSGQSTSSSSEVPSECFCGPLHRLARNMTLLPHQACVALKRKPVAKGNR